MKTFRAIVFPLAFALVFVFGFIVRGLIPTPVPTSAPPETQSLPQTENRVAKVLDGDTIELADGTRVRYAGIDAPELHERFGTAAYELNKKLVADKMIRIEISDERADLYGRTLGYIYLQDGIFVNEKLVEEGYATVLSFNKMKKPLYYKQFLEKQKEAEQGHRGMWVENWK